MHSLKAWNHSKVIGNLSSIGTSGAPLKTDCQFVVDPSKTAGAVYASRVTRVTLLVVSVTGANVLFAHMFDSYWICFAHKLFVHEGDGTIR